MADSKTTAIDEEEKSGVENEETQEVQEKSISPHIDEEKDTEKLELKKAEKPKTKKEKDLEYIDLSLQDIINMERNLPFKEMLANTVRELDKKKFLNEARVQKELELLNIDVSLALNEDSDIELYNDIIDDLQRSRDRVCSLYSRAQSEFHTIDSYYSHLFKVWTGRFSRLSSDKRREGEAEFILHFLLREKIKRENLFNSIKNIYLNLGHKMEAVSRKITVIQQVHRIIGYGLSSDSDGKEIEKRLNNHRSKLNVKRKELKEARGTIGWGEIKMA